MRAAGAHRTDLRSQLLERSSRLRCQRLPQDFAMLGFGRAAVLGGAQLEAGDELIIEIADDQLCHFGLAMATMSSLSMPTANACQAEACLHHKFVKLAL